MNFYGAGVRNRRSVNTVVWSCLLVMICFLFPVNLYAQLFDYFEPPPMEYPEDNPWSEEKENLGKLLFFDARLSKKNTISCASCHDPEFGWANNTPKSKENSGEETGRNTPSLYDTGYYRSFFLDGRAKSLEQQLMFLIKAGGELGLGINDLIKKLKAVPEYVEMFQEVFGEEGISQNNIAQAISTFERSIVSGPTRFDLYSRGNKSTLSPSEIRGMRIFFGKGKCSICHNGPLFSDNLFYNIGVIKDDAQNQDSGRFKVTKKEYHRGAFKTPALRNVSKTAPYMHDGSLKSLEEVVGFYDKGGKGKNNTSPFIEVIGMGKMEQMDLVNFLKSLDSMADSNETRTKALYNQTASD